MERKYLAVVIICLGWTVSFPTAMYLYPIIDPPPTIASAHPISSDIVSVTFNGISGYANNTVSMAIQNTGHVPWTISGTGASVNGKAGYIVSANAGYSLTLLRGDSTNITISDVGWKSGSQYNIELLLTSGDDCCKISITRIVGR